MRRRRVVTAVLALVLVATGVGAGEVQPVPATAAPVGAFDPGNIISDAQFFDSRETYDRYGIPWRRGAIFIGPPGNGKTHTVKALINYLKRPCLYVRNFTGVGTVQGNMTEVFKRARRQPTIVVLEDLD